MLTDMTIHWLPQLGNLPKFTGKSKPLGLFLWVSGVLSFFLPSLSLANDIHNLELLTGLNPGSFHAHLTQPYLHDKLLNGAVLASLENHYGLNSQIAERFYLSHPGSQTEAVAQSALATYTQLHDANLPGISLIIHHPQIVHQLLNDSAELGMIAAAVKQGDIKNANQIITDENGRVFLAASTANLHGKLQQAFTSWDSNSYKLAQYLLTHPSVAIATANSLSISSSSNNSENNNDDQNQNIETDVETTIKKAIATDDPTSRLLAQTLVNSTNFISTLSKINNIGSSQAENDSVEIQDLSETLNSEMRTQHITPTIGLSATLTNTDFSFLARDRRVHSVRSHLQSHHSNNLTDHHAALQNHPACR